jgi:hypothetical protein
MTYQKFSSQTKVVENPTKKQPVPATHFAAKTFSEG